MRLKKAIRSIQNNWPVKVLCIAAALSLWLYVSSTQNKIASFPSPISINITNVPQGLVAISNAKVVDIKIMADPSVWSNLTPESFTATVDMSGTKQGTHQLAVNVNCSVPGVQIVEKDPAFIFVTLEPVITKDVPVVSRIQGQSADGMVPGSIVFSPAKVQIKGAESEINNVSEAVAIISLNGESSDITRSVKPVIYDDQNQEVKDIEVIPDVVEADISVVKGSNVKTVGVKVNIKGTVKNNFYISNVSTAPGAVDISGIRDVVLATKYIETTTIDVSDQSTTLSKTVSLSPPNGISVLGNNSSSVQVTITISPIETPKEFDVNNFQVTSPKYAILSYNPTSLKVSATAALSVINALSSSDFSIVVDLTNQTPDANGNFNIAIDKSNIHAPDGVSIISIGTNSLIIKTK